VIDGMAGGEGSGVAVAELSGLQTCHSYILVGDQRPSIDSVELGYCVKYVFDEYLEFF
jgi:hypothetical protein